MQKDLKIPDIGDFDSVEVIEVLVKDGDIIKEEDTLVSLETDKATMDVPSPFAGKIIKTLVKVGDRVSTGDVIFEVEVTEVNESNNNNKNNKSESNEPLAKTSEVIKAPNTKSLIDVLVPDIGTEAKVEIIEVQVKPGDILESQDTVIVLESDKASMDIPTSCAGIVKELFVKVGDKIGHNDKILSIEASTGGNQVTKENESTIKEVVQNKKSNDINDKVDDLSDSNTNREQSFSYEGVHAGPSVRKLAREFGVDLVKLKGTGRKGRISKEDLQNFVKSCVKAKDQGSVGGGLDLAPLPDIDFSKFGKIEKQPLSRIKKLSGSYLHRNWVHIPHVTHFENSDITDLEKFRQEQKDYANSLGVKLTPLVFLMKASVAALKEFPEFNSSLDVSSNQLILKKYYNIGVAVDTEDGLVVPVIKDVDSKGLFVLAKELSDISQKAREGKLSGADMQGGCFSISSLGGIGGTGFTPIVNMPEVCILGVSKSSMQPVFIDGEFKPRLILPFSLSYDHRVIDGAQAARFCKFLADNLSDIRKLLF